MYFFYGLEQIKQFPIFENIDFSVFSPFEVVATTVIVNLFYLCFLAFVFSVVYKAFNRLYRLFF